jgi:hypothetical protein
MNEQTMTTLKLLAAVLLLGAPAVSVAQAEPGAAPAEGPAAAGAADAAASEAEASDAQVAAASARNQLGLEPVVAAKLSADQIVEIVREREATRRKRAETPQMEAVIVPTATFGFIALVIFIVVFYRFRRERVRHETLRAMVEKGVDIPPELLVPPAAAKKHADLRRGLVLLGSGLGLIGFFALIKNQEMPDGIWGIGLIPALIGVGYLLVWWLEKKGLANGNGNGNRDHGPAL